eukprot:9314173-Alexandrium_andersonii.AAC.1
MARSATLAHGLSHAPARVALHASADPCPIRVEGAPPAVEQTVHPKCGAAHTTTSAPNIPKLSAAFQSAA